MSISLDLTNLFALTLSHPDFIPVICHDMACRPHSLPALRELELYEAPEWDIFFIMVENRILAAKDGVCALKRVIFHGPIPSSIVRPLSSLVRGYITPRPPNFYLSILGNLECMLDPAITGCSRCIGHLNFGSCPYQPSVTDWEGISIYRLLCIPKMHKKYFKHGGKVTTTFLLFCAIFDMASDDKSVFILYSTSKSPNTLVTSITNLYEEINLLGLCRDRYV